MFSPVSGSFIKILLKSKEAIASTVFYCWILISSAAPSTMSKNFRSTSISTIDHSVQLPWSLTLFFLLFFTYSDTKLLGWLSIVSSESLWEDDYSSEED